VRFAAATTGAANLLVAVAADDLTGLCAFLTDTVGSLGDIRGLEVAPIRRADGAASDAEPPAATVERFVAEFSGTDHAVAEYLLGEMLGRQPAEGRTCYCVSRCWPGSTASWPTC